MTGDSDRLVRCHPRSRDVTVRDCIAGYVDATALRRVRSQCCSCPHGSRRRHRLALDLTIVAADGREVLP